MTKQGFLIKDVFSPLVYASPLWLSPPMNVYEVEFLPLKMCTRYNFSPKNVYKSHIKMTIHFSILSSKKCCIYVIYFLVFLWDLFVMG